MKRFIKSLVLVAFFIGTAIPAWSQASTQGKEFWVSSTLVCSPDKATPAPYIAVSAEKECTVKIQGGVGNAISITQKVGAGSWSEFGNGSTSQTDPTVGPVKVPMDASKWYPTNVNNANNVYSLAAQKNMYGLHITATENISVYVILSSKHSMDASNILPMNALGTEYYTQDYWSQVKSDFADAVGLTTILGTEDNTRIKIVPNGDTFDGWASGSEHYISLNKGQTYYLVTKKGERLSGTYISSDKKIAVYCGVPITNVPSGVAARDCLFEQTMPVDYWGTQFVVTRSLEKNGNLIGITASVNGTSISVDGYEQETINAGDTYYIMLQSSSDPNGKNPGNNPIDLVLTQDAAYIETSCPCAVYSYDTGNSYKGNSGDEVVNGQGDPSSVWVSPIQQKIGNITFGTCYTDKTKDHFLNVTTETPTRQNTKLTALFGTNKKDKSDLLTWTPVPGNIKYSYARAKIGDSGTKDYSVFNLQNSKGFIATVYGNGEDESYAYSAGSSAVELGVEVNGETFSKGTISDSKFCFDQLLEFNAGVGANDVTRVDWNFGDGVSEPNGEPQVYHAYNSPGWYDVTAVLYGYQACSDNATPGSTTAPLLDTVYFSFRVVRPDTVYVDPKPAIHIDSADYKTDPDKYDKLIAKGENDTLWDKRVNCYDPVEIQPQPYCMNTSYEYDKEERDSALVNGTWYYSSQDVVYTIPNRKGCDSVITCHLTVIACLKFQFLNGAEIPNSCLGEGVDVGYAKTKGDIGKAHFVVPGVIDTIIGMDNENTNSGILTLPTEKIAKPGHYTATITVEDPWCDDQTFSLDFDVYYPKDIFKYKFNNVLAVYSPGYGGNKDLKTEFTAYQWYFNGTAIPGANESIYHTEGQIPTGNYFVELTDKSGMTQRSCAQDIVARSMTSQAPARKLIRNGQICIQIGEEVYDIYGQKVQ